MSKKPPFPPPKPRPTPNSPPPHLKTLRAQPIFAHRALVPIAALLAELGVVFGALARHLDDEQWAETADALWKAARAARSPYIRPADASSDLPAGIPGPA